MKFYLAVIAVSLMIAAPLRAACYRPSYSYSYPVEKIIIAEYYPLPVIQYIQSYSAAYMPSIIPQSVQQSMPIPQTQPRATTEIDPVIKALQIKIAELEAKLSKYEKSEIDPETEKVSTDSSTGLQTFLTNKCAACHGERYAAEHGNAFVI